MPQAIRHRVPRLAGVFAASIVGLLGCSSSSPSATTAAPSTSSSTAGSSVVATAGPFCTAWAEARRAGAAVDTAEADQTVLKAEVAAALAATKAATALAPADFADLAAKSVAQEEGVVALLEKYDYSFANAFASEDGNAFFSSADYTTVTDQRDAYLATNCGLSANQPTTGQPGVVLSPGDEGIRQLFQLLQIGGQLNITDDQIDCLVDALSGKISDADLQAIGENGSVTDAGTAAFVEALSTCGVVPTAG
ncbi:MAG: hypothetical protein JWN62_3544 [Acidimicrobiales bacterium]|nr:hypothetical protein [Acidimicrobiales bacterium]